MSAQTLPVAPDREPVSHPVALLPAVSDSSRREAELVKLCEHQKRCITLAIGYLSAGKLAETAEALWKAMI